MPAAAPFTRPIVFRRLRVRQNAAGSLEAVPAPVRGPREAPEGWWAAVLQERIPPSRARRASLEMTLADLRRGMAWCWVYCEQIECTHKSAIAIAPFIIRWGSDASAAKLRRHLRCSKCGSRKVSLQHPGHEAAFPDGRPPPPARLIPHSMLLELPKR
jgi:hypothetical protein